MPFPARIDTQGRLIMPIPVFFSQPTPALTRAFSGPPDPMLSVGYQTQYNVPIA